MSGKRGDASRRDRYAVQERVSRFGPVGQERVCRAWVTVVGCGATGGLAAEFLVRAGVGRVRLVDRDVVEAGNLHRQVLFTEEDARLGRAKAEAGAARLRLVNPEVQVEGLVGEVRPQTVEALVGDCDLLLDGTDNFETRYLLNDYALSKGVPWIYAGVVGTTAMVLPVVGGETACLRCVFPDPPAPGSLPTCETEGVLGPVPGLAASLAATQALRILATGAAPSVLLTAEAWDLEATAIRVERAEGCVACGQGRFEFLSGRAHTWASPLCGRQMVHLQPPEPTSLPLERLEERLSGFGPRLVGDVLHLEAEGLEVVLFRDGRALVRGTQDEARARSLYLRLLGR